MQKSNQQSDRDAFIALLARLVVDGVLSESDAHDLVVQFDAGELGDNWELPLPTAQAIRGHDRDKEKVALALLLLLSDGRPLKSLTEAQRIRVAHQLQDVFANTTQNAAGLRAENKLTIVAWQSAMLTFIDTHLTRQAVLGTGGLLTDAQNVRVDQAMVEQSAYLQRFADHAALQAGRGEPYSEEYIANRSQMYGGPALGEFFQANEEAQGDEEGYVWQYIAIDDKGTCSPCHSAQGFYLNGQGPMPGTICFGGAKCRCRRERVYNPAEYQRLIGA